MTQFTNHVFADYEGKGSKDLQKILLDVHNRFCDAEDKCLAPQTPTQFMIEVNAGKKQGFSTSEIFSSLHIAVQTLKDLEDGTTTARKIMGKGGRKSDARAYLANSIEESSLAAEFGGFLEIVNIRNYSYHLRKLLRENGVSF